MKDSSGILAHFALLASPLDPCAGYPLFAPLPSPIDCLFYPLCPDFCTKKANFYGLHHPDSLDV